MTHRKPLDLSAFPTAGDCIANPAASADVPLGSQDNPEPQPQTAPNAQEMLSNALSMAKKGLKVFPLHGTPRGRCTCGKSDCGSPGKHPRTKHGLDDASGDPAQIQTWWRQWPTANLGLRVGKEAGVIVLDIDPRNGGDTLLANWEATYGPLPPTLSVRTGGGGWHHYFRWEPGLRNGSNSRRHGIDVKTDGGYVVAPPSLHASGRRYAWATNQEPAPAPAWLIEALTSPKRPEPVAQPSDAVEHENDRHNRYCAGALAKACERVRLAPEGTRNDTLNREAFTIGGFAKAGHVEAVAAEAMLANAARASGLGIAEAGSVIARAFADAEATHPSLEPPSKHRGRPPDGGGVYEEDNPKKDQILVGPDLDRVARQARASLCDDSTLYQNAGRLVTIVPNESERLRILPLKTHYLRERLATVRSYVKFKPEKRPDAGSTLVETPVPSEIADMLLQGGAWPGVPPLRGLVDTPVLRADGSVLQEPGYDRSTGLFYEPMVVFPRIPNHPTLEDARRAIQVLEDVFVDFPFADEASRSAVIAAILTPLAWPALDGKAPIFVFDANIRGSGKTMLAQLCGTIATGTEPAAHAGPPHDEECEKRIVSYLRSDERLVLLDNISGPFGWPSLDCVVTSGRIGGRILGSSESVSAPAITTWFVTANNVDIGADAFRRIQLIRLDSVTDRPENRSDFRRADLRRWVRANLGELTTAALTILAAYCAAGRPDQPMSSWGSFEGWSSLVRGALLWAGKTDPRRANDELDRRGDPEEEEWRSLVAALAETYADRKMFTSRELLALVNERRHDGSWTHSTLRGALLDAIPAAQGQPLPSAKTVGKRFSSKRHRPFGSYHLHDSKGRNGNEWLVRPNAAVRVESN